MKLLKISRRRFLLATAILFPGALLADAAWLEPNWLKIRRLRMARGPQAHRFVHFTDLHFKGNHEFALSVVKTINALSPDFVCFTGDLVEERKFLPAALNILSGIKSPMYGVPGNHDYWAHLPFGEVNKCFTATGGAWLLDEQRVIGGRINLMGASCRSAKQPRFALASGMKNILLMHYPDWVGKLGDQKFDLMLAGHTHGGQVRIPFYGALIDLGQFDLGLFQTVAGPLYVNPGIGWFATPFRFNCRPELTIVEI